MRTVLYYIRHRDGRHHGPLRRGPSVALDWLLTIDGATPFESWNDANETTQYVDLVTIVEGVAL